MSVFGTRNVEGSRFLTRANLDKTSGVAGIMAAWFFGATVAASAVEYATVTTQPLDANGVAGAVDSAAEFSTATVTALDGDGVAGEASTASELATVTLEALSADAANIVDAESVAEYAMITIEPLSAGAASIAAGAPSRGYSEAEMDRRAYIRKTWLRFKP